MLYKPNWEEAKERYEAFWNRSCIDRPALRVIAKKSNTDIFIPKKVDLITKWTDINYVLDSFEEGLKRTYFAAEALPNYYPDLGPAVLAAFMGSKPDFQPDTVWFSEIIDDFENYHPKFDQENNWWKKIKLMTSAALERGKDKYFVGFTDFHGCGDALLHMRGSENLCMDFIQYPGEIKSAINYITNVLEKCSREISDMILKQQDGTTHWMGIWGKGRQDVLQADVGALIGPKMFEEFFLDEFIKYINTLDRSIFHVDGPDMIKHLDLLLDISKLDAIQWVPGDGNSEAIEWIPMLKRVQAKGKSLFVYSSAKNVEGILKELSPKGLYIHVYDTFENETKADEFIKNVLDFC